MPGGWNTALCRLSGNGVSEQEISDTAGKKLTRVSESACRHVTVLAIRRGTTILDGSFGAHGDLTTSTARFTWAVTQNKDQGDWWN
jgi:hypothetical protein